jgi:hypothetical protein
MIPRVLADMSGPPRTLQYIHKCLGKPSTSKLLAVR